MVPSPAYAALALAAHLECSASFWLAGAAQQILGPLRGDRRKHKKKPCEDHRVFVIRLLLGLLLISN
jgi:hypothetical protein